MRNLFFERDRDAAPDTRPLPKKFRRAHDQVVVADRQRRIIAGKFNLIVVPCPFDREPVGERNRRHERFNFVKPVSTALFDLERKIDLRGRRKLHILQFVQQATRRTE